ncbi:hypothetical protein [Specibacter sp. NPDC078692]|uniref:hypothetical protein n=1 Tax=Specibacter sp. NPDC078692 TaxID=3155818 RepID=UPI00341D55D4
MQPTRGYVAESPFADWPFGEYHRTHKDLAAHLHQVGRHHAKKALLLYTSQDEFDQLDAAYSLGSAVELLAKSLLASVDTALLMPRDPDALTILKYSGTKISGVAPPDALSVRSLEAGRAIDLLREIKLFPPLWAKTDRSLFNVRNAAAHMGIVHQEALRSAIRPMVRFAEHTRTHHNETPENWWGKELAGVASTIAESEVNSWIQVVQAKIAASHVRLSKLRAGLPASSADAILTSMEGYWRSSIAHIERVKCPACGFRGWATGDVDRAVDIEYELDGPPTVWSVLTILIFECNVCGLELSDETEVSIAGLAADVMFLDEDYVPEPDDL